MDNLSDNCIKIKEEFEIKLESDYDGFIKEEYDVLEIDASSTKQREILTSDISNQLQIKEEVSDSSNHYKNSRISQGLIDWKPDEKKFISKDLFKRSFPKFTYNCLRCDYDTNHKRAYEHHILAHSGKKLFKCSECSFETNYDNYLKIHTLKQHPGVRKALKCSECAYETYETKTLAKHYKVHLKKDYKCPKCDYSVPMRRDLRLHILSHTGKKFLNCSKCDFQTPYQKWLTHHQLKKHENPKSYKCTDCDHVACNKSQLDRHRLQHKDIVQVKCSKCEYKTIHKARLNRHMREYHN